jgi:WD40 repeat protein
VSFSPDGKRIVSGSVDNTLKVWDAQTGQETLTLKGHADDVNSVSFSPDGKRIVSGSDDETVKVWDAQTGQERLTLKGHSSTVTSVSFSPDGKRIVSGSYDNTLKVWDAQTGQETLTLKGHSDSVTSVSFSPDGKRIVSGSDDKTLNVWDAQTGQETLALMGHSGAVLSVSFSPDGKRIVSGSYDNTLKVWDAHTGLATLTLKGHLQVYSVSFSPDGKRIASGSFDETVKVWDLDTVGPSVPSPTATTPLHAVAPFDAAKAGQHQQAWADHLQTPVESTNSIVMKLRLVPAGEFTMGSPRTESYRGDDETQHRVTLTKPFYLGVTEVTQEQYQKVMGTNPSHFKGPQNPVETVFWADAVEFCRKLSAMPAEKTAGHLYRLPTEAEWEYACRSGTTTAYGFGDDASRLGDYGWFDGNPAHRVGEKKPNAWGLYDMHGNVWEWCQDWYGAYPSGSATDPTGARGGSFRVIRVIRGGSWISSARVCRSADRSRDAPGYRSSGLGFRVLRSASDVLRKATDVPLKAPIARGLVQTLRAHSNHVTRVSFSPDGNQIVSGGHDKTVKVWDMSSLDTSK